MIEGATGPSIFALACLTAESPARRGADHQAKELWSTEALSGYQRATLATAGTTKPRRATGEYQMGITSSRQFVGVRSHHQLHR